MKQNENEDIVVSSKDERLNILFFNKFYYLEFFGMGVGNEGFVKNNCKAYKKQSNFFSIIYT